MKKLIIATTLAVFAFSSATYAATPNSQGMRDHKKPSNHQMSKHQRNSARVINLQQSSNQTNKVWLTNGEPHPVHSNRMGRH